MDDLPDDFQDASGGASAGAGAGVEEVGVQTQLLLEEVGIQTEHLLEELAVWEACTMPWRGTGTMDSVADANSELCPLPRRPKERAMPSRTRWFGRD